MLARLVLNLALISSILGLSLAAAPQAAEASVRVGPRYDWFHSGGYFHAVAGAGGGWIETIGDTESFYFQQTDRNDTYVELFDASRSMSVRLYADAMYLKAAGEADYRLFYYGHWDDRRLYGDPTPGAPVAYFDMKTAQIWHWVRAGAQTLYMREILRNDDQIQLYNGAEGLTVSLMDNAVWMKKDGFAWFRYSAGAWD